MDLEKAYDHINWNFLLDNMQEMNFHNKWINWVKKCICSCSFSVMINGEAKGFFNNSRGPRQRDPISPFCFTNVMEVLSQLIDRARQRGLLKRFRVGEDGSEVKHLQFADDTLFLFDCQARLIF